MLEVIVQNKQEAIEAEKCGADRVELVSAIQEGGLTPSIGTLKQVIGSVTIPVQVMVRPHSYSFSYSLEDMEIIREDVKAILDLGGSGIVFGALRDDHTIDENKLMEIIEMAPQLDITFHRAFDEAVSQKAAYRVLAKYKSHVKRILTSGGERDCEHGKDQLRSLVELSREMDGPKIMPGAGLSPENIRSIHSFVRADEYHFGKAVRLGGSFQNGFDVKAMQQIMNWTGH
ncbi:copper homeostasis protein CutC [Virgibacillus siamensis]|uniref:copper homeostasis protein CutC n=1 Tax=Virgibacillus siamensis TaxID=480071 RepID=UPI001FE3A778|nr:copper homeostasis protein CutC [Virgibacillus siamensis]